ncbi:MAG: response regulator transcription factor [Bacteroidales bacterium]|nr:response regulator transcription factor [Bacteroidales bacterium]MBN2818730.1 response regulator transcription factor [Bacteroidales bacterium]
MKSPIKIIIADDNKTYREGIRFFIEKKNNLEIISEASNGKELLSLTNVLQADIILLDLEMPQMDGFETIKQLLIRQSKLKVIAITMYSDLAYLHELISYGFKGYIHKSSIYENLDEVIDKVMDGLYYFPKELRDRIFPEIRQAK